MAELGKYGLNQKASVDEMRKGLRAYREDARLSRARANLGDRKVVTLFSVGNIRV